MARLQILELPEGANDDRPPFVLVVDRVDDDLAEEITRWPENIATRIGARQVLCFPGTIDIPANDTTAYLDAAANGTLPVHAPYERAAEASQERTDIARDMDRLAKRRDELADALGLDRTGDWDDIRKAATELRRARGELERLRAGEEPVTDRALSPTPGQWIWQWNRATPEKRLAMASQILDSMAKANDCWMLDHEARLGDLQAEVQRLRNGQASTEKPDA
ncbi:hypothetical protein [Streptomyces europaeiscabiei]|uniref:hypothetical protein n=1 Tax=Streptomyces europaeiscabiei TaxID=146819 RepID=UPI0029A7B390|nr:hypothetical protein [Streptomyces europaeiscabiei]MDX2757897.1 hypothetical protein [Streptomyces europaeiscabiei]